VMVKRVTRVGVIVGSARKVGGRHRSIRSEMRNCSKGGCGMTAITVLVEADRLVRVGEIGLQHGTQHVALDLFGQVSVHGAEGVVGIPAVAHLHQHVHDAGSRRDIMARVLGEDVGEQGGAAARQAG